MAFVDYSCMDNPYSPVRTFCWSSLQNSPKGPLNPSSIFLFITTVYLLSTSTLSPDGALPVQISSWATFLGVSSALLAAVQYAPQLVHTYRMKLVGALSIPMMLIQSPGGALMVTSIALREGTDWTSAFLVVFPLFAIYAFFFCV